MGNNNELEMMKKALYEMTANRQKYEKLFASGYVCAGFGGDLNGIQVPETFLSGKLPSGVTPQQAFEQVLEIMRQTIAQAELQQKTQNKIDYKPN